MESKGSSEPRGQCNIGKTKAVPGLTGKKSSDAEAGSYWVRDPISYYHSQISWVLKCQCRTLLSKCGSHSLPFPSSF